jgi:hypothetical protein
VYQFDISKYNMEYRKNKSIDDIIILINQTTEKNPKFENQVTLLSVNLKNYFKKMKLKKYTVVSYDDAKNVTVKHIITDKNTEKIKKECNNFITILSGHCNVELS